MTLTALDFPASPTAGDLYPDPPVTGQPTYKWSGTDWLAFRAAPLDTTVPYAPFAAMAYSGMQINGDSAVSQEIALNASALLPNNYTITYGPDMWRGQHKSSSGVAYIIPWTNTPPGLAGAAAFQATTAFGATAAGDIATLATSIEGYRWRRCMFGTASASPVSIAFWAYAPIPGTATLSVSNSDFSRCYTSNFTINAAGVWEYKTITVPGCTDGTWLTTNGLGALIAFCFCAGTTFGSGVHNTWNTTQSFGTPQTTRFFQTNNNLVAITGLVVLPGTEAPSASQSPLIMRPYDQELVTCKRYWQKTNKGSGTAYTATDVQLALYFDEMRANPTVSLTTALGIIEATTGLKTQSASSIVSVASSPTSLIANFANFTGLTVARPYWVYATSSVLLDARL